MVTSTPAYPTLRPAERVRSSAETDTENRTYIRYNRRDTLFCAHDILHRGVPQRGREVQGPEGPGEI